LKLSVAIITNEINDSEVLIESWIQVFDQVCGEIDFEYVQLVALPDIQKLIDRKSPFLRRKLGNRLLMSIVMRCGELAIDSDRNVLRLVLNVCSDTNYKIRMDGAVLFKHYLRENHQTL
jgi:hypothetical protein